MIFAFRVKHMYSSRSAGAIVKALRSLDQGAKVRVNMETNLVEIEPSWARRDAFREAIGQAGFSVHAGPLVPAKHSFSDEVDVPLPLN